MTDQEYESAVARIRNQFPAAVISISHHRDTDFTDQKYSVRITGGIVGIAKGERLVDVVGMAIEDARKTPLLPMLVWPGPSIPSNYKPSRIFSPMEATYYEKFIEAQKGVITRNEDRAMDD